jgi:hypothetical protein
MRAADSEDSEPLLKVDGLAGKWIASRLLAANAESADDLPKSILQFAGASNVRNAGHETNGRHRRDQKSPPRPAPRLVAV